MTHNKQLQLFDNSTQKEGHSLSPILTLDDGYKITVSKQVQQNPKQHRTLISFSSHILIPEIATPNISHPFSRYMSMSTDHSSRSSRSIDSKPVVLLHKLRAQTISPRVHLHVIKQRCAVEKKTMYLN